MKTIDKNADPGRKPEPTGHDCGGDGPARGDPARPALGGLLLPQDRAARPFAGQVPHQAQESRARAAARAATTGTGAGGGRDGAGRHRRIQQYLTSPGNLPSAHGIALFACSGLKLFEAVALPFVHRSRLAVDRSPLVRELVAAQEEFGRLYAVVTDRSAARIFEVTAAEAKEVAALTASSTRGGRYRGDQDAPGWGEYHYNNRIREEKQRHYDAVAQALFTLDRADPAHGILVAGTGADAAALTPFLHQSLQERVVASIKLNAREVSPVGGARGGARRPGPVQARRGAHPGGGGAPARR